MRTHTSEFKEELKVFGRQIQGKIIYYPSYDLISENDDNILTETDLQIISEQANYDDPIEINEEDIFSISIIKNGDLLQSLMKEFDFESKIELNIGSVVNPQFGLLVNEEYEYLNYGNYIINSKEFNMDTETWSYVCYDKMLFSMVKYRGLSNVEYPITIKQFINKLCDKVGLEFEDSEFVNQGQLIYEDLYKNRDVTYRDIFDEISKIVAGNLLINDNDKLEVGYVNLTSENSLPKGYTQVDYIESTGTQYIDTGRKSTPNTKFDFEYLSLKENGQPFQNLIGSQYGTTKNRIFMQLESDNDFAIQFPHSISTVLYMINDGTFSSSNTKTHEKFNFNEKSHIIYDLPNRSITLNQLTCVSTSTYELTSSDYNILIFNRNSTTTPNTNLAVGKLYNFKWYENNVLIMNLIPCYRNSDNEVGLYDLVNDVFYINQGTGTFTYGQATSDTISEDYLKDTNVRMSEKIGVINSVAILDSDNNIEYVQEDTQSIKENEMTRVTITDNLLALNGDTNTVALNILNKLNGLYYYANDLQTTGVCYYDFLDLFNVEARGNTYQCLLLNNEITITQGIEEHIFTEKFEEAETSSNEYTTSVMTNKQIQFNINQQEGRIESKVEKDGVISAINQSAEEIQINANKLSLEGKNINLTGDNIKITGENLDIDSKGQITLFDDSAEQSMTIDGEASLSYSIKSSFKKTYQGYNHSLDYVNRLYSDGRIIKYENNNEIPNTSGTGHFIGGIDEFIYKYPNTHWYRKSYDYNFIDGTGWIEELNVGIPGIEYSKTENGVTTYYYKLSTAGVITCVQLIQTSKEENKKNFEKLTNAKDILNQVDIYKYNFKDEDDSTKKSIGFVIGDNFNYSKEITSENNDGANIYSMVSVLWQVVKEQQEEINQLKEMINNGKY